MAQRRVGLAISDPSGTLARLGLWPRGVSENGSSVDPETLLMFPIVPVAGRPGRSGGGDRGNVSHQHLLDEPLSALDHATQSRIIADSRQWNEARGIPILYVTHSQREAFALGELVLILQDGSVVAAGRPNR